MPSHFSFGGIFRHTLTAYKQHIVVLRSGCAWESVSQLLGWDASLFFPHIHAHVLLWGGRGRPCRLARSTGTPQPSAELTNTAVRALGCSVPSPHSCHGTGAYNSKAFGGSVLEGSLMSTFWSLTLRDKEESMWRFLFIMLKSQVASV